MISNLKITIPMSIKEETIVFKKDYGDSLKSLSQNSVWEVLYCGGTLWYYTEQLRRREFRSRPN